MTTINGIQAVNLSMGGDSMLRLTECQLNSEVVQSQADLAPDAPTAPEVVQELKC